MVSPQVYCDIEEVLMWFAGKDYSNSMPKVYRFTIYPLLLDYIMNMLSAAADAYELKEGRVEYGRYVDDFYLVSTDKNFLMKLLPKIREYMKKELGLTLHPKKVMITEVRKGIAFIGAVIKPWGIYVSNRTVGHAFEVAEIERVKDLEKHVQRLNSYFGFMKYRLTYAIRWRLFNAIPEKIKKKIVCVNMQKFRVRHLDNARRKVA